MDVHKKGVGRVFGTAVVSVLVLIVLVSVLFYFAPQDEAIAGQAKSTGKTCTIPGAVISGGQYVCGAQFFGSSSYQYFSCSKQGELFSVKYDNTYQFFCNNNRWTPLGGKYYLDLQAKKIHVCDTGTNLHKPINDHYCTGSSWVKCDATTKGQGVENFPNAGNYRGEYYCNGFNWVGFQECNSCFGSKPGKCVGTNVVQTRATKTFTEYYFDPIKTRAQCVTDKECVTSTGKVPFDSLASSGSKHVCGNNNHLLLCDVGDQFVSDGGKYYCNGGKWEVCSKEGAEQRDYICIRTSPTELKWQNKFACGEKERNRVRDGGKQICAKQPAGSVLAYKWVTCQDLPTPPNEYVEYSCDKKTGIITVKETGCSNNLDDDNDQLTDCADKDCSGEVKYTLNTANRYEVVLTKGACFNATLNSVSLVSVDDPGNIADRISLSIGKTKTKKDIRSISALNTAATRPSPETDGFTFIFEESKPGKVSAILTQDISGSKTATFPRDRFASNLLWNAPTEQERIILSFDTGSSTKEYFLLSHPKAKSLRLENLTLMHLPTRETYAASAVAGKDMVMFNLNGKVIKGDYRVTLEFQGTNIVASSLDPGESLGAFAAAAKLNELFEIPFTKTAPVRVEDPAALGRLTLCKKDLDQDLQQALVCQDDKNFVTLKRNNLTKVLNTKDNQNYAFLYEVQNGQKVVTVFNLTTVSSKGTTKVPYRSFITSMNAARRFAIEFENELYLMGQPKSPSLKLPSIKLTHKTETSTTGFVADGSEDRVEFMTLDGKVVLKRNYGSPPPPFELTAFTKDELLSRPGNLDTELFTSMSSEVPVRITTPNNFDIVRQSKNDIKTFKSKFVISTRLGEFTLNQGEPFVPKVNAQEQDVLFYYHTAEINGIKPIKTLSAYRLYKLDPKFPTPRAFNDSFISTFAGGKEIALRTNASSYYLLGYQGNANKVQFFDFNNLTLRALDDSQNYTVSVNGGQASFNVPEGEIKVGVDVNKKEIAFSLKTAESLAAEDLDLFYAELTPTNTVKIGSTTLRMSFLSAYLNVPTSARVDYGNQNILVRPSATIKVGSQEFLLEVNGEVGNDKKVIVRRIVDLTSGPYLNNDWNKLANEIQNNKGPVFNVSSKDEKRLYLSSAKSTKFEDLTLSLFPNGKPQKVVAQKVTDVISNGTLSLADQGVFINQRFTNIEATPVDVSFRVLPYSIVPLDKSTSLKLEFPLGGATQKFATKGSGPEHTLTVQKAGVLDMVLVNYDSAISRLFAKGDTKHLKVDGAQVVMEIEDITKTKIIVKITRK